MGCGVAATRRQRKAAIGSVPRKRVAQGGGSGSASGSAASAAKATNAGLARAVGQTNRTRRRDGSLANVRAVVAHGSLTGDTFGVPQGKSVIVLTPPGMVATTLANLFLRHREDVHRLVVGHLRPANQDIYVKRFDAGQRMPDMLLSNDHGQGMWGEAGVYRLPFAPQDYHQTGHATGIARPSDRPFQDNTRLSEMLRGLPDGKYIVTGCRGIRPVVPMSDERKRDLIRLEMETPVGPARSDPGSLTAGEPVVPETARSVNWLGDAAETLPHYDGMWPPVRDAVRRNPGRPLHVSGKTRQMKRLPFNPLRR